MNVQRVLIIDDDKDLANLFRMVLSLVGFECDIVHSAKEGLAWLTLVKPDIVLLDLRLGLEIGGEDILYQIRSNPRFKNTRVIVITGYPLMAEPVANLADLILLKPVEIEQLKTLVQRLASQEIDSRQEYFRDPSTGLFNQDFFYTRLEHAYERAKRRQDFLFLVVAMRVDIEAITGEVVTNDVFDRIMRDVARSLVSNFRPTDTIARLSRNRFATLHEELKDPEDVGIITQRLRSALVKTYQVEEAAYQLFLNVGTAISMGDYEKPEDILNAAESAWAKV